MLTIKDIYDVLNTNNINIWGDFYETLSSSEGKFFLDIRRLEGEKRFKAYLNNPEDEQIKTALQPYEEGPKFVLDKYKGNTDKESIEVLSQSDTNDEIDIFDSDIEKENNREAFFISAIGFVITIFIFIFIGIYL